MLTNIRLRLKWLTVTSTLAYSNVVKVLDNFVLLNTFKYKTGG
jgi:hypothetical protein